MLQQRGSAGLQAMGYWEMEWKNHFGKENQRSIGRCASGHASQKCSLLPLEHRQKKGRRRKCHARERPQRVHFVQSLAVVQYENQNLVS